MAADMFTFDPELADRIFAYCRERLAMAPVALDFGGTGTDLTGALEGIITPLGTDPAAVLELFTEVLAPRVISGDSERFLAFIPAAPTKASLLFDMIVSASALHAASWLESAGAVAAENQVLELLASLAGLPSGAGGCFVSGGSLGNLSALAVARDDAYRRRPALAGRKVRIALSQEAHSSSGSALHLLHVDPVLVPTVDHQLTGAALAKVLADDPDPETIVAVAATAGTTNAGIIDDLAGVAAVAQEHDLWFHVDGAYGLAGLLSDAVRPRFAGLELADSFIVDPHKWLFAPFDACALLYRRPQLARAVHTQHASYLDILHDDHNIEWNPSDYAVHLSRRPRGLPIWFSLAVHGTAAYGHAVDQAIAIAHDAAALIEAHPDLELIRQPGLSIVLFRRRGWTTADYEAWSERLVLDQIGFVTPTGWEGETVARFAFLHPHTTLEMVEEILATMR